MSITLRVLPVNDYGNPARPRACARPREDAENGLCLTPVEALIAKSPPSMPHGFWTCSTSNALACCIQVREA